MKLTKNYNLAAVNPKVAKEWHPTKNGKLTPFQIFPNSNKKYWWICKNGHVWSTSPNNRNRGKGCRICAGLERGTIQEMKYLAHKRNGKCMSTKYHNAKTKLKWKCEKNHIWLAAPDKIKRGTWCPICGIQKRSDAQRDNLESISRYAKYKGGRCLSTKYNDSRKKLRWRCKYGHEWEAIPNSIKRGHWCPVCTGNKKLSLIDMQKIAEKRGGKCLSEHYANNNNNLEWRCKYGHKWFATPHNIKKGQWCPYCRSSIGEELCRLVLQDVFKKDFPRVRLKGFDGLELDGFNKLLMIAFEYHGIQHYKQHKFYKQPLKERKRLDALKRRLCKIHKIKLIEIPCTTEYRDIPTYIISKLKKMSAREVKIKFDHQQLLGRVHSYDKMNVLHAYAKLNGGKCLSNVYLGSKNKLIWECKFGHQWNATPGIVQRGHWCPHCGGKVKLTLKEMHKLASLKEGQCLSKKYINARTKLKWMCKNGHVWQAIPECIKRGQWCPTCAIRNRGIKRRLTIEEMHKIARSRSGSCLSEAYINAHNKIAWQCKYGHTWEATPSNVKQGKWCPTCARARKR